MSKIKIYDKILATGLYSGYSPIAPGTMGALVGLLMWIAVSCWMTYLETEIVTLTAVVVITLVSIRPINRLEAIWGKDPARVVIDEVVGVLIGLLAVPEVDVFSTSYWFYAISAFVLFRLFDIWKPFGIRKLENIQGGWGVMLDDIGAGIVAGIVMIIMRMCGVML